jgi:hypothetical protein
MINFFLKLFVFSLFFTVVIFFINYNFFSSVENNIIEEKFIDPEIQNFNSGIIISKEEKIKIEEENKKKFLNKKYQKHFENKIDENINYNFYYNPINFRNHIEEFSSIFTNTIRFDTFYKKINFLQLEFLKEKLDTRGKMTRKKIKLF